MSRSKRISSNNNRRSVWSLAVRSVKSSKMKDFFVILTIVLSVSLLMVMSLFYVGMNTETKRTVARMQHAIYYNLEEEQLTQMAKDERSQYVLSMKEGQAVEVDGNMVKPAAYGKAPLKNEGIEIDTVTPTEGKIPEKAEEIMLSDAYCKLAGIKATPGETVSFTWLDGTTENYRISGIYHTEENQPLYTVLFSEAYAREGSQLKEVPWEGIVCFYGADEMTQPAFEELVYGFGDDCGVTRKDMNINNFFLDALPGGDMAMQQMMVVICAGIGLLFVSVLVIYSVFYLSVVGRIRQFGQLRTIGMTKRQIRRMVRIEGLFLSALGIPIGLLVGGVVSYVIRPGGWDIVHTLIAAGIVTVADVITVLISVQKPAKKAASVSPVEAAKYSGYTGEEKKKKRKESGSRTIRLARKITPTSLAVMSNARNKKKTVLTMISLGIGGILYMLAAFFVTSTSLEGYARQGEYKYGEFVIGYSYNVAETAEHGETQLQKEHPLDDKLLQEIEKTDGVKNMHTVQRLEVSWEAHDTQEEGDDNVRSFPQKRTEKLKELKHTGDFTYEKMVEEDGILFTLGGAWEEVYGWEFKPGDKVKLSWYDGEEEREKEFTIMGIIDANDFDEEPGDTFTSFLIPEQTLKSMTKGLNLNAELIVETDQKKEAQVGKELKNITKQYPYLSLGTLEEQRLIAKSNFNTLFSVMLGLSMFIIGFALLNLLNTLITNILTRSHEFAMLQSVGMTRRQLCKMLRMEGLILAAGNLAVSLVLGTAAGYAMIQIMNYFGADYMHFVFPVWYFLGYAAFILLVPVLVTEYMVRKFQKQPLVDRLR